VCIFWSIFPLPRVNNSSCVFLRKNKISRRRVSFTVSLTKSEAEREIEAHIDINMNACTIENAGCFLCCHILRRGNVFDFSICFRFDYSSSLPLLYFLPGFFSLSEQRAKNMCIHNSNSNSYEHPWLTEITLPKQEIRSMCVCIKLLSPLLSFNKHFWSSLGASLPSRV